MRCEFIAEGVEHAMPSEIVIEVAGGHTMETLHPALPSAVIGVDVLYMKRRSAHANTLSEIDGLMNEVAISGVAPVHRCAIRAQHRCTIQTMADRVVNHLRIDRAEGAGQGMAFPIGNNQDPDFVVGITAFSGFLRAAAALAGRPLERPRSLVRPTHGGFIGLGDSGQDVAPA